MQEFMGHNLDIREKKLLRRPAYAIVLRKEEIYEIRSSSVRRKEKYKHLQKGEGKKSKSIRANLQINGKEW